MPMHRLPSRVAVLTAAAALAVAACGGDDEGDTPADAPTPADEGAGAAAPAGDGKDTTCEAFTDFAMRPADAGGNGLGTLAQDLAGVEPPAELAAAWAVLTAPGIDDASATEPDVEAALDQVAAYADRECPVPAPPTGP